MLKICKKLFDQWNENDIRYCHWKSNEHLMEGLDGKTDLDIYVAQHDKELAESLLRQCRFIECRTQKYHQYPNVFEWIGFDEVTGKLVHVHLHYQIITGTKFCKEFVFPIEDTIISTRKLDPETEVYVTDPNLEIILLYCRIALKAKNKKAIRPGKSDCLEIGYLKTKIQKETVLKMCNRLINDNGNELYSLIIKESINAQDWYSVYLISSKWLKPYRKLSSLHVFLRHSYYRFLGWFVFMINSRFEGAIINKKTFPNRNFSICLLGQDGSGKSTVTIELCKWFNWKLEAHRFYLGSGEHYHGLFKTIISKGSKIKHRYIKSSSGDSSKTTIEMGTKKQKKTIKTLMTTVLFALNRLSIARRAYREVLRSEKYRKKGGIPLFDRFPQIQFEGIYDGPKIANSYEQNGLDFGVVKLMAKMEYRYLNKIQRYQPKLVFKLLLSPEESIRRKPFENIELVTRKHEITKQIEFPQSIVYEVDAAQDYEQELIFIKTKIWNTLLQEN